jgi:hypothetical protein
MFLLDEEDICSKEEQKQEALYRMNKLNILPDVIDTFEKSSEIKCSDYGKIIAVPKNILKDIRRWEADYGCLAYHVVHSKLYGFEIYNALSVSNYKEDWDYETTMIDKGRTMAYTINVSKPDFSESGTIILENHRGTLQRII